MCGSAATGLAGGTVAEGSASIGDSAVLADGTPVWGGMRGTCSTGWKSPRLRPCTDSHMAIRVSSRPGPGPRVGPRQQSESKCNFRRCPPAGGLPGTAAHVDSCGHRVPCTRGYMGGEVLLGRGGLFFPIK